MSKPTSTEVGDTNAPITSTGISTGTTIPISSNPTTSTWDTASGTWWLIVSASQPQKSPEEILSKSTQKLIEIQKDKWPNAILELNCSSYDTDWKEFCRKQQVLIKKFNEEDITWEETLKKWSNYIKSFDCTKIHSEYWQKYCKEYQASIVIESTANKY